ncbi:coiled-coil domain-containing protein 183 isoform X2 [Sorex araneus]|uniref:coiled-coil domain-containing protein 183 isoform X2 n=1 Tax=Sorex araneus TaxID=42254 RepID=UPI0024335981|nr:coiled-coil domain-containing protein 183 isoform X2 [Sorex araneus]
MPVGVSRPSVPLLVPRAPDGSPSPPAPPCRQRNMKKMETTFMAERRAREQRLSQQKRLNDRLRAKDVSDKLRRQGQQDRHFASSLLSGSSLRGEWAPPPRPSRPGPGARAPHAARAPSALPVRSREPSMVDDQDQSSVRKLVEQVKSSVQCSHLWDITGRFQAQKSTEESLEEQMRECAERQAQLQALEQQLELEELALKFRQGPSLVSSKSAEGRVQVKLREEQERLRLAHASMVKRQQLLLTVEMGVNNLYFRLIGATPPEAQKAGLPPKPLGMFDKLAYCEERLVQLADRTQMLTKTEEVAAGRGGAASPAPSELTLPPAADQCQGEGCPGVLHAEGETQLQDSLQGAGGRGRHDRDLIQRGGPELRALAGRDQEPSAGADKRQAPGGQKEEVTSPPPPPNKRFPRTAGGSEARSQRKLCGRTGVGRRGRPGRGGPGSARRRATRTRDSGGGP